MKKEMVRITSVVLIISLAIFLSLNLVSASWFSDFLGKITGNAVLNDNEISFMDWDGVGSPENKDKTINYQLEAIKIENKNDPINISNMMIYSSSGNLGPYSCKYPCYNFTVKFYKRMVTRVTLTWNDQGKSASGRIVGLLNADVACEDSDNGQIAIEKGVSSGKSIIEGVVTKTDSCVGNSVNEYFCEQDASANEIILKNLTLPCTNNCEDGKCKAASPTCTPATCASLGKECGSVSDGCGNLINCGSCASGKTCANGACVATGTVTCDDVQDCPTNVIGAPSCEGNQLCRATGSYSCINPGTTSSYCNLTTGRECETCVNGCADGNCLGTTNSSGGGGGGGPSTACTDSDGGNNRYVAGATCANGECRNDSCWKEKNYNEGLAPFEYLTEYYCSDNGNWMDYSNWTLCPDGCFEGACKKTVPVENEVCQNLINLVANPENLVIQGINYGASNWNNHRNGKMWVNNQEESYIEYSANWGSSEDNYEGGMYSHYDVSVNMLVFEDEEIDLTEWIKDRTNYMICEVRSFWDKRDNENIVYICGWDILNNRQSLDSYQSRSRQVLWINKNVIVELYAYHGKSLTDEEIQKIANKKIDEFLNDLKNNEAEYVEWENFDIGYVNRAFVENSLSLCDSEIKSPTRKGTNLTCSPNWNCKTEPVICPPHGYQTKTCVDYSCDQEREEQIYCSPGLCSGCYVPRWLGSRDNTCIPYGFRFSYEFDSFEEQVYDEDYDEITVGKFNEDVGSESDFLSVVAIGDNELAIRVDRLGIQEKTELEYSVSINPDETVDGVDTYYVSEGDKATITFKEWGGDKSEEVSIAIGKINYNSENPNETLVGVIVGYTGTRRTPLTFNAYCDIDGIVKEQKTNDYQGNWARCQNNYECFSNVCSGGECIDVQGLFDQVSGYKSLGVKILCRLSSFFSIVEDYESCVVGYLGNSA